MIRNKQNQLQQKSPPATPAISLHKIPTTFTSSLLDLGQVTPLQKYASLYRNTRIYRFTSYIYNNSTYYVLFKKVSWKWMKTEFQKCEEYGVQSDSGKLRTSLPGLTMPLRNSILTLCSASTPGQAQKEICRDKDAVVENQQQRRQTPHSTLSASETAESSWSWCDFRINIRLKWNVETLTRTFASPKLSGCYKVMVSLSISSPFWTKSIH